jgi:hypothetical protein
MPVSNFADINFADIVWGKTEEGNEYFDAPQISTFCTKVT